MSQPLRLKIRGFRVGVDRLGQFLTLELANDQPFTYFLAWHSYETEGIHSGAHGPMVELAPETSKSVRFPMRDFHDVAFRIEGHREPAARRTRRCLGMLSVSWLPRGVWTGPGHTLVARPSARRAAECARLAATIIESGASRGWTQDGDLDVWPARVVPNDGLKQFVAISLEAATLRVGPFLRIDGRTVERYGSGHAWHPVVVLPST